MYVNTLITLQENLPTYAQHGQHIMGHVTLMSPGWVKCYVQNLKPAINDSKYTFFIFSKAHQKGVRLGELSKQKETKWLVDETNIEESGLTLNDIDGVCVIDETEANGADIIAMGFMNGRYIIMPMIDTILRKLYAKKESKDNKEQSQQVTTTSDMKEIVQPKKEAAKETTLTEPLVQEEARPVEEVDKETIVIEEPNQEATFTEISAKEANEANADEKDKTEKIAKLVKDIVQKTVKKEDKKLEEALEEAAELEFIAATLKSEEDKRVVDSADTILYQNQEIKAAQEKEISDDLDQTTPEKTKEEKKGMTAEDLLRVLTQVNNDQELKEKIAAFGKQLKVISQFATRNGKWQSKEAEENIQNVPAPMPPSPLAQPLEAIEKLLNKEIEPKTEVKGTLDLADTSPRNALQFIKTYTQKKTKGHTSKKEKNRRTNYMDTIDKKIEDIQLRREQEMKDPLE